MISHANTMQHTAKWKSVPSLLSNPLVQLNDNVVSKILHDILYSDSDIDATSFRPFWNKVKHLFCTTNNLAFLKISNSNKYCFQQYVIMPTIYIAFVVDINVVQMSTCNYSSVLLKHPPYLPFLIFNVSKKSCRGIR